MTFQSIFKNFQSSSNGTDAFKHLKIQCEQSIQSSQDPLVYSSLFLIYSFAKNYVLLYEDQAVASVFAKQAKDQLIQYMSTLNHAINSQDSTMILIALNDVSKQYFESSRVF